MPVIICFRASMSQSTSPVLNFQEMLSFRQQCERENKRFVLTNGCFDILHAGHLSYLMQSAQLGDCLVVAVNSDESVRQLKGPTRPINSENARAFALSCLRFVDAVFIFPGPRLANEIETLRPDIYTKAGDYTLNTLETSEREALIAAKTEIQFMPMVPDLSTTKIISALESVH